MDRILTQIIRVMDGEDIEPLEPAFDEKTNGQAVMEALRPVFPNVKVKNVEDYCGFGGFSRHIDLIIDDWTVGFPIEWWEEPYKGGR